MGRRSYITSNVDEILRAYQAEGRPATQAITNYFWHAAKSCSPRVEAAAIRLLQEGQFLEGPFKYMAFCSSSEEALKAVENAVPHEGPSHFLAVEKQNTLRRMRTRMAKTTTP
jgi:hypothetical protein